VAGKKLLPAASAAYWNIGLQPTAYSVHSVRRASGMEECGNTSGIQVLDEPLELSAIDHSMV
jgi:hypothetical protein